ncbi:MAG: class I SAM-dependent methyltransferase [Nitrososphaerales archaeon]
MLHSLLLSIQDRVAEWAYRNHRPLLVKITNPQPEDGILDLGGGTGWIAATFADICREVFVLDPDQKKLTFGKERRKNVRFIPGSADRIPFRNDYFSKVMIIASFHHFADQESALKEIRRVMHPNGLLVLLEFDPTTWRGKQVNFFENTLQRMNCKYYTPSQLEEKVKQLGYEEISIIPSKFGYFLTAIKPSFGS